jgi:thiazole synthase ThiGH ThiG subunit
VPRVYHPLSAGAGPPRPHPSDAEALLGVDLALMTDEALDAAIALVERHQAIMARALERWSGEAGLAAIEAGARRPARWRSASASIQGWCRHP